MAIDPDKLAGKFIVLDGPDGAGKGTQLDRLESLFTEAGVTLVRARDPGGTAIGDRIRTVLLDFPNRELDVRCEMLLFMASRAQLMAEVIEPALTAGRTVLCDRFVSATCAYQGAGGVEIKRILELAPLSTAGRWPDLTLVLDVEVSEGFQRTGRRPPSKQRDSSAAGQGTLFAGVTTDALESRHANYHRKVRDIFLSLPECYPAPVTLVDGRGTPDQVTARLVEVLGQIGS